MTNSDEFSDNEIFETKMKLISPTYREIRTMSTVLGVIIS